VTISPDKFEPLKSFSYTEDEARFLYLAATHLGVTGKALSHRANITTSKSYIQQSDYRFDMKTFAELRNAQSVAIAYDGSNPMPPMFCYLKPYYNDPNKSYFQQASDGEL